MRGQFVVMYECSHYNRSGVGLREPGFRDQLTGFSHRLRADAKGPDHSLVVWAVAK